MPYLAFKFLKLKGQFSAARASHDGVANLTWAQLNYLVMQIPLQLIQFQFSLVLYLIPEFYVLLKFIQFFSEFLLVNNFVYLWFFSCFSLLPFSFYFIHELFADFQFGWWWRHLVFICFIFYGGFICLGTKYHRRRKRWRLRKLCWTNTHLLMNLVRECLLHYGSVTESNKTIIASFCESRLVRLYHRLKWGMNFLASIETPGLWITFRIFWFLSSVLVGSLEVFSLVRILWSSITADNILVFKT